MFGIDHQNAQVVRIFKKCGLAVLAFTTAQVTYAGVNVGKGGGSLFDTFTKWIQDYIDFLTGPFAVASVVVGAVIAFATWIVLPKEGIVAWLVRIVIGGLALLNLGGWIYAMSQ